MTLQDLINWLSINQYMVLIYFGTLILLTILVLNFIKPSNINTLKYIISFVVYGVTIPGILSCLLVAYSFFIIKQSLLQVNFIAYFLPILAMIGTLLFINSKMKMKSIPGFKKLSGLMTIIAITFLLIFLLQKMHFGLFFFGGFTQLIIVFVILFIILRIAWNKLIN